MKEDKFSPLSRSRDDLEERIAHLSPTKRALLELKSKQKGYNVPPEQVMSPRAKLDRAPPSFTQHRLSFLDHLDPGGLAYNRPAALRLSGSLDP